MKFDIVISKFVAALILALVVALQIPFLTTAFVVTHAILATIALVILLGVLINIDPRPDLKIWNADSFLEFFGIVSYFIFVIGVYHYYEYEGMVKLHILIAITGGIATLVNNHRVRKLNQSEEVIVS